MNSNQDLDISDLINEVIKDKGLQNLSEEDLDAKITIDNNVFKTLPGKHEYDSMPRQMHKRSRSGSKEGSRTKSSKNIAPG